MTTNNENQAASDLSESAGSAPLSIQIAEAVLSNWDVGLRQPSGCSTLWLDPDGDLDTFDVAKLAHCIATVLSQNRENSHREPSETVD